MPGRACPCRDARTQRKGPVTFGATKFFSLILAVSVIHSRLLHYPVNSRRTGRVRAGKPRDIGERVLQLSFERTGEFPPVGALNTKQHNGGIGMTKKNTASMQDAHNIRNELTRRTTKKKGPAPWKLLS